MKTSMMLNTSSHANVLQIPNSPLQIVRARSPDRHEDIMKLYYKESKPKKSPPKLATPLFVHIDEPSNTKSDMNLAGNDIFSPPVTASAALKQNLNRSKMMDS